MRRIAAAEPVAHRLDGAAFGFLRRCAVLLGDHRHLELPRGAAWSVMPEGSDVGNELSPPITIMRCTLTWKLYMPSLWNAMCRL